MNSSSFGPPYTCACAQHGNTTSPPEPLHRFMAYNKNPDNHDIA